MFFIANWFNFYLQLKRVDEWTLYEALSEHIIINLLQMPSVSIERLVNCLLNIYIIANQVSTINLSFCSEKSKIKILQAQPLCEKFEIIHNLLRVILMI